MAWKAVGVHDSLRVTCITGHTSRQNLCPEEKQLYAALRHCAANSCSGVVAAAAPSAGGPPLVGGDPSARGSGCPTIVSTYCASSSGLSRIPGVNGPAKASGLSGPPGWPLPLSVWVIRLLPPVRQITCAG
ncbi:hypothetical protein [Nocardioides sp. TF02-7]|uniref:hypothetical protein n=1 Tax=Nocardioides sp. TF02-7 TaxID=2917724 RepID=UPI001F05D3D9|nr:hypothetical protein [Nocardioides sp. TF02-7]UMG91051.1 hypothetical protein MF408_12585 [Nocardioides sp. TF02-7]